MVAAEVAIQHGVEYAVHDGVALHGDLYVPSAPGHYPALVCIHGGAWYSGGRDRYRYWGPFLAQHGYVVFAISYRLATDAQPTYPQNVHDVRAAVQFLRGNAAALNVDPARIGALGDSAGGHLAALLALAGDAPCFASPYREDPFPTASARLKVAVPIYAVLDLVAQWEHDQLARPWDQFTPRYLGCSPVESRTRYREASPVEWTTTANNGAAFLVVWGTADDIVDYASQSVAFVTWLKRAGNYVRTVPITGAPHYWIADPLDEPGSYTGFLAPRLRRFLAERL